MRNLLLLASLLFASVANAQNVVTVTAEMGSGFANGAIVAQQIVPGGNGSPSLAFFFNSSGNMSAGLPSNGTWMFRFCNTSNVCFNAQVQLPGVLTQDVTTTFTTATTSGGIAAALVSPNDNIVHVSGNCSTQVNCFQTNANTQQDNVASWSPSNGNITIAGGANAFCNGTTVPCAAGKVTSVGMNAWGATQCRTDTSSVIEVPYGTITSVTSATVAVISTTPTTTRTASGCFTWGNYDDTALTAAENYASGLPVCPSIILSAGMYLIQNQHFKLQPPSCARLPGVQGISNLGGFGFAWGGVGEGATRIVASPAFTANTTILGNSGITILGMWLHDFSLDCGGDYNAAWTSTNNAAGLVNLAQYSKMENVMLASCGALNTHVPGVAYQNPAHLSYATIDAFGGTCLRNNGTANIYADHSAIQDCLASYNNEAPQTAAVATMASGGQFFSIGGNFFGAGVSTSTDILYAASGGGFNITLSDFVFDNGASSLLYGANIASGGYLVSNGAAISVVDASNAASAAVLNNGQVWNTGAGSYIVQAGATSVLVNNNQWFDLSRAGYVGAGGAKMSGTGFVIDNASASGTIPATGNFTITNGTFTSVTGANQKHFTLNLTASASATLTVAYTFPTSFLLTPPGSCHATQVGGTNPVLTFTTTVLQTVSSWTFASTAAATNTDTFQIAIDCQ